MENNINVPNHQPGVYYHWPTDRGRTRVVQTSGKRNAHADASIPVVKGEVDFNFDIRTILGTLWLFNIAMV